MMSRKKSRKKKVSATEETVYMLVAVAARVKEGEALDKNEKAELEALYDRVVNKKKVLSEFKVEVARDGMDREDDEHLVAASDEKEAETLVLEKYYAPNEVYYKYHTYSDPEDEKAAQDGCACYAVMDIGASRVGRSSCTEPEILESRENVQYESF